MRTSPAFVIGRLVGILIERQQYLLMKGLETYRRYKRSAQKRRPNVWTV
ncbi:MAG: hypothetical protein WC802_03505 [Patescibacteria group bacterium]|jgi:hypothetical protein